MTNHDALIEYAKSIDDAAKMLCVATKDQHIPAELLHDLAGFLGSAMYRLGKLCPQLSGGARAALAVNEVYDRNRDPAESIGFAIAWLQQAAESAAYTGHCLAAVQTAVDAQGTITARPPQTVPETPAELMAWLADGDTIQPMQPRPETATDVAAAGLACSRCGTVLETRDGTVACPNGHSQDGNGPA